MGKREIMGNEKQKTISVNITTLLVPGAIILAGLFIGAGLFLGLKSNNKVKNEKQIATSSPTAQPTGQKAAANQIIKTSIDDDAVMGDIKTAKVAIVEFSDYECSFCKRFRDQTLPQIKKDYIETGKAIFVYRDLPLPFHNPAAEREAMAAECAREQGGDEAYYQYHDQIYDTTPGNGKGISLEDLARIAEAIGLNGVQLKNCTEEEKYKSEVSKDSAAAAQAGIKGTPGFVVGKLNKDGSVEGVLVSGAQPYSVFQSTIDQQLK